MSCNNKLSLCCRKASVISELFIYDCSCIAWIATLKEEDPSESPTFALQLEYLKFFIEKVKVPKFVAPTQKFSTCKALKLYSFQSLYEQWSKQQNCFYKCGCLGRHIGLLTSCCFSWFWSLGLSRMDSLRHLSCWY